MRGEVSADIDKAYDTEPPDSYRSKRIGASMIGDPCEAKLAFLLRGFPDERHPARLKRIFRDGHRIEDTIIRDLRKAGYNLQDKDPFTGKQYEWTKYNEYLVYKADGIIEVNGESLLFEAKSMNDALFSKFKNKGVRISHPHYYKQVQIGMGMSGLKATLFIAYNKDNSFYWDEVVPFDEITYYGLLYKTERVLTGLAEKVAVDKTDWRCRDCSKCAVCWDGADVVKDMRTCKNAYPDVGKWSCPKGCVGVCQSWERYEPAARKS